MRLFEQINRREVTVRPSQGDQALVPFREVREAVRSSVRVIADECAAWSLGDTERWVATGDHSPFDLMGPLRLPFDSMWFEWVFPKPESDGARYAAWITAEEPGEDAPSGSVQFLSSMFFRAKGGVAVYPPLAVGVYVGELGEALGMCTSIDPHFPGHKELTGSVGPKLIPAWVAIGLMNCRNVQVTESPASAPVRSSRKRARGSVRKPEPLSHHTITLPGSSRIRNLSEAREASGQDLPLHVVRGHFKTFTAEAPLLGKYVGTYWWRPAVRGSSDAGRIETSYRVRPT